MSDNVIIPSELKVIDLSDWKRFMQFGDERKDCHGWPFESLIWYAIGKSFRHIFVGTMQWPYLMESLHKAGGRFEEDGSISLFGGKVKVEAKL